MRGRLVKLSDGSGGRVRRVKELTRKRNRETRLDIRSPTSAIA